jgi:hypothetical protein
MLTMVAGKSGNSYKTNFRQTPVFISGLEQKPAKPGLHEKALGEKHETRGAPTPFSHWA